MSPEAGSGLAALEKAVAEGRFSPTAGRNLRQWLEGGEYAEFHTEIREQLARGAYDELEEAFYQTIPFGTAGQRGPTGAGPNRINSRTIAESVQGVCNYIRQLRGPVDLSAVVGYDTRRDSARLAQITAEVLAGNGVRVELFADARPTPELSHAVIQLRATLGFMISASHNPPADDGVKVYWDYGGQVLPEHADGIIRETAALTEIRRRPLAEAQAAGQVVLLGAEMDASFQRAVLAEGMGSPASRSPAVARIVYTPLHGTGVYSLLPVLAQAGWHVGESVFVVASQEAADPDFKGVPGGIPNPENPESFGPGVELARKVGADLLLGSDPDADRLAAVVPGGPGEADWLYLKGGQLAALIGHWVLSELQRQQRLPKDGLIARSIITSDLVDAVAESFGVRVVNNLPVGFKYIAKVMSEADGTAHFLFGTEQSYGFLKGSYCRDKDSAIAALLLTEAAEQLKRSGSTLVEQLRELWRQHGYHAERATPIRMEGVEGRRQIAVGMAGLRAGFPAALGGVQVTELWDLQRDVVVDPAAHRVVRPLGWNWNEDVLIGRLAQDPRSSVSVRPSGTEPSLKVYTNIRVPLAPDADPGALHEAAESAEGLAEAVERDLLRRMGIG